MKLKIFILTNMAQKVSFRINLNFSAKYQQKWIWKFKWNIFNNFQKTMHLKLVLEMMFPLSKMDLLGHHMFDKGR